jgi:GT2 family glycosyltransferase
MKQVSPLHGRDRSSIDDDDVDVSALIVNYNSGAFAAELIRTLRAQSFRGRRGGPGKLQIIVLDNASPRDQAPFLEPLASRGVEVIYHDRNEGYGAGVNAALRHAKGEYLLISNPDVLVMSGAIDALLERLRQRPRTGLVGPRGWLDPDRFWLLPPIFLHTMGSFFSESLGFVHRPWTDTLARRRSRSSLFFWTEQSPFPWHVVSGYGFMMPRELAVRLGPFDERYPLYYEDCDLSRRVAAAGYDVEIVPRARMIHLYNRSAGQDTAGALAKHDVARRYYYEKFYGRSGAWLYDRVSHRVGQRLRHTAAVDFARFEPLGERSRTPRVRIAGSTAKWVAELAVDPCFFWKAGHYGEGDQFEMPELTWNCLDPTTFYLRFLDPARFTTIAAYSIQKVGNSILNRVGEQPPPWGVGE